MNYKGVTDINNWKAVMQLIRLPNVFIIILTQFMVRFCIIEPFIYSDHTYAVSIFPDFLVLVLATVLIAAGGYIINDYFDVKIDSINRPEKIVVNKLITARAAIKLHMLLNGVAIILGFYLAFRVKAISFGLLFPFISGLLWIYSAKYKRVVFWGNFIVASSTAFVILMVWLFEFFWLRLNAELFVTVITNIRWVTHVFLGYAIFAFLISMVREIIKDMEDAEGDESYGCRTIPLVAGIERTRYLIAAIILVTMVLLGYAQLILYRLNMNMVFWYFFITVQFPLVYLLAKLFGAREKQDYHNLSNLCKLIMVAGILSMQVLLINN
ncbi:MAG: geranylgeranylglycerol-phosphate geranylgeranyltransferase [Bacteroidota bacterium]